MLASLYKRVRRLWSLSTNTIEEKDPITFFSIACVCAEAKFVIPVRKVSERAIDITCPSCGLVYTAMYLTGKTNLYIKIHNIGESSRDIPAILQPQSAIYMEV